MMGAAGEILDGFEDAFLDFFQGTLGETRENLFEARDAEERVVGVHGFRDAVAEKHEGVARLKLEAGGGVLGFGDQADGVGAFREGFFGDAAAN